jgi:ferredoxin/flavodoxin---NADP+ reductase
MVDIEPPNATLIERRDVTESIAFFRVAPDAPPFTSFEAGQFGNLGLPVHDAEAGELRFVRRAYSMGSAPKERASVEFYLRLVDGGRFTTALFALGLGGRLWLDPNVYGRFTLAPVPVDRDVIFIASGTGVAPYVSMLREFAGSGRWRRAVVVESVRESREFGYRGEFETLAARDADFRWLPTVTREPAGSGWTGSRGRIQTLLEPPLFERLTGVPLAPATAHVFLCGNPQMLEDVGGRLAELGFQPHSRRHAGQVHVERYW